MQETTGAYVVRRTDEIKKNKMPWLEYFQILGEYVSQQKLGFTAKQSEGSMLNENLFDSTGVDACTKSSAALIGMLWRSGSKSFQAQPPRKLKASNDVKKYFEFFNETMRAALDDPKAGFANAYSEYMADELCFGTAGLGVWPGTESDLSFEAWGVDEMGISHGRDGQLLEISREYCWELRKIIDTYGLENLSPNLQERAKNPHTLGEKFSIIHFIDRRRDLKAGNLSNLNMPIRSVHVERDTKHEILESGFPEMPVEVGFHKKLRGETYGRSPAMNALPDILELNALRESRMYAIEMQLEPPTAMYSDSILGNAKLDMSPRATNIFKASAKLKGGPPVFPLYDGGNIREADKAIEEIKANINSAFMLDRLIDFNNQTEMTLGEVQFRAQLRGESLGEVFSRQNLVLQNITERATSIMYRAGKLGLIEGSIEHRIAMSKGEEPVIIPDEIAKLILGGKEFYEIKFLSPAARMMEAEEANGIRRTYQDALMIAQAEGNVDVLDGLEGDKAIEILSRNNGAPPEILAARDKIEAIRQQRAQIMEQQAQAQQAAQEVAIAAEASNIKPAA